MLLFYFMLFHHLSYSYKYFLSRQIELYGVRKTLLSRVRIIKDKIENEKLTVLFEYVS